MLDQIPAQVVHLLLGPQPDDFAWVQFAESFFEAIVIFDVTVSVLELIECCFKHLQHHLVWDRLLLQAEKQTLLCLGPKCTGHQGKKAPQWPLENDCNLSPMSMCICCYSQFPHTLSAPHSFYIAHTGATAPIQVIQTISTACAPVNHSFCGQNPHLNRYRI